MATIDPTRPPSGEGCVDCLATADGWWYHLRRCATCGRIGCCDSSPSQHASRHAAAAGHPIFASFEPDEDWLWDVTSLEYAEGPELAPPRWRPADQPVPAPADRVPEDWEDRLN
jgi:hypothetical protein